MKTKDEIIESIWSSTKKKVWFPILIGIVICCVMPIHSYISIKDITAMAIAILIFTLISLLELAFIKKKSIKKVINSMMNENNSKNFTCMGYAREYFHPETRHLPDELKTIFAQTKSYEEFITHINGFPTWIFGGGMLLFGGFISSTSLYEMGELWTSPNLYLAIVLFAVYIYFSVKMTKKLRQKWFNYFIPVYCDVNLKESLPDLFGEYDVRDTIIDLRLTMQRDGDKEETVKQVASNFVAYIKKQYEERTQKVTKGSIVVKQA